MVEPVETIDVAVVGAGFAGTTLIRALARKWPGGLRLTLISDESYTTFSPLLPEAVGASIFPEQVVVPGVDIGVRARFGAAWVSRAAIALVAETAAAAADAQGRQAGGEVACQFPEGDPGAACQRAWRVAGASPANLQLAAIL